MDTTTAAIASGVVVVAGMWSEGKGVDAKALLGAGFLAIFLSVLSSVSDELARGFALLVLLSVLLRWGTPIAKKAGWAK